jgi:hypothetical protein
MHRQEIAYCDSDRVTILANLCKMPSNFSVTGLDTMAETAFNNDGQIKNLLHFIHDDKPGFLPVIQPDFEHINRVIRHHFSSKPTKQASFSIR